MLLMVGMLHALVRSRRATDGLACYRTLRARLDTNEDWNQFYEKLGQSTPEWQVVQSPGGPVNKISKQVVVQYYIKAALWDQQVKVGKSNN